MVDNGGVFGCQTSAALAVAFTIAMLPNNARPRAMAVTRKRARRVACAGMSIPQNPKQSGPTWRRQTRRFPQHAVASQQTYREDVAEGSRRAWQFGQNHRRYALDIHSANLICMRTHRRLGGRAHLSRRQLRTCAILHPKYETVASVDTRRRAFRAAPASALTAQQSQLESAGLSQPNRIGLHRPFRSHRARELRQSHARRLAEGPEGAKTCASYGCVPRQFCSPAGWSL